VSDEHKGRWRGVRLVLRGAALATALLVPPCAVWAIYERARAERAEKEVEAYRLSSTYLVRGIRAWEYHGERWAGLVRAMIADMGDEQAARWKKEAGKVDPMLDQ
jgi:hypothetical protein